MSSRLRYCLTLETPLSAVAHRTSPQCLNTANKLLTTTSVYEIASKAKSKLGDEADRHNRDLRRMVGHANLLDTLMSKLFDSEIEREDWLYQDVHTASAKVASRCLQWIDRILDDIDNDDNKRDEHNDDPECDEIFTSNDGETHLFNSPLCRVKSRPARVDDEPVKAQGLEIIGNKFQVLDLHDIVPALFEHSTTTVHNTEPIAKSRSISNVVIVQTYEVD